MLSKVCEILSLNTREWHPWCKNLRSFDFCHLFVFGSLDNFSLIVFDNYSNGRLAYYTISIKYDLHELRIVLIESSAQNVNIES